MLDAIFIDVYRFFTGTEGYTALQVTSLPEDIDRRIPVDTYELKITATSGNGDMAVADLAFTPRVRNDPSSKAA